MSIFARTPRWVEPVVVGIWLVIVCTAFSAFLFHQMQACRA